MSKADAVLAHESRDHYNEVQRHYESKFNLENPEEQLLAALVIQAHWRLSRAQRLLSLYHNLEVNGWSDQNASPDEIILRNMAERGTDVPTTLHRQEAHFQRTWWKIMNLVADRQARRFEEQRAEAYERLKQAHEQLASKPEHAESAAEEAVPIHATQQNYTNEPNHRNRVSRSVESSAFTAVRARPYTPPRLA